MTNSDSTNPSPSNARAEPAAPGQAPFLMRFYSSLLHSLPVIKSGLTKLSFNPVVDRLFAGSDRPIVATMLNGVRIAVEPNDYHGRILYLFGTNDPKVMTAAWHLLRPGDTFLDIGANYSTIGLTVAEKVGPQGRVHLFEPQPAIAQVVEDAIGRAHIKNVELHRVALMDRDAEMVLSRPPDHSGMATLVDYGGKRGKWDSQVVPVRDTASYLPRLVEGVPFGAKVDVEGAEKFIMPWLLQRPGLRFIIFESAHEQRHLLELVQEAGLQVFGLCRQIFRSKMRRVDSASQLSLYHDLVAVRLPASAKNLYETTPKEIGELMRGVGAARAASGASA